MQTLFIYYLQSRWKVILSVCHLKEDSGKISLGNLDICVCVYTANLPCSNTYGSSLSMKYI